MNSRVEHVERVEVFNAEAQRRGVRRGGCEGLRMVNQSLIDVCASFISGGQPPDPHCVVPCRAAALKHSAYSAPLR